MSYIDSNLLKSEKLIYFTRVHWIVFAMPALFLLGTLLVAIFGDRLFRVPLPFLPISLSTLMTLICLGVTILAGLDALIRYLTSEYGITNKRVLIKTGWIQRNSLELFLRKVEAIYVDQSILGRLFDYGTLRVVGTGGTQDPFFYIPNPLKFRRIAQQQVDKKNAGED